MTQCPLLGVTSVVLSIAQLLRCSPIKRQFQSRAVLRIRAKLGSPEVQPRDLLYPRKQNRQISRSGPVREESTLKPASEEEPCFEDPSGNTGDLQ